MPAGHLPAHPGAASPGRSPRFRSRFLRTLGRDSAARCCARLRPGALLCLSAAPQLGRRSARFEARHPAPAVPADSVGLPPRAHSARRRQSNPRRSRPRSGADPQRSEGSGVDLPATPPGSPCPRSNRFGGCPAASVLSFSRATARVPLCGFSPWPIIRPGLCRATARMPLCGLSRFPSYSIPTFSQSDCIRATNFI